MCSQTCMAATCFLCLTGQEALRARSKQEATDTLWSVATLGAHEETPQPRASPEALQLLFELGANRAHVPRCVVSAALAAARMFSDVASLKGSGAGIPAVWSPVAATLQDLGRLRPTLLRVLRPVADAVAASNADGLGCVLSGAKSPADVAAALTAAFTALQRLAQLQAQGLVRSFSKPWLQLLSACATILAGLSSWLVDGGQGWGSSGSSGATSGSSGASGGSSGWGAAGGGMSTAQAEQVEQVLAKLSGSKVSIQSAAEATLKLVEVGGGRKGLRSMWVCQ